MYDVRGARINISGFRTSYIWHRPFSIYSFSKQLKCMLNRMKNFTLLLVLLASQWANCLLAQAQASVRYVNNYEAQTPQTTYRIGFSQASINDVFSKIERIVGSRFIFNEKKIGQVSTVNIADGNYTLDRLLTMIELQTGLQFKQISNMIAVSNPAKKDPSVQTPILALPKSVTVIEKIITGKVTDSNGEALVGVNILIKGTTKGTLTDVDGNFKMTVEKGDILVVSFVGFKTQEIKVTDDLAVLNIKMEDGESLSAVTVIGSRGKPRTDVERPVPVDVLTAKELQTTGQTELGQQVQYMSPSFNSAKNAINGIANYADPASLKGLAPDQMLVLIEGKRYHQFAAIQTNVTVGKGTVVTDLNAVPSLALERMEILRDGAAAQYGSDAIAGIANLVLKKSTGKGTAQIQYGGASKGDAASITAGLNYGFALGKKGFLNLTGTYTDAKASDRSDPYNPQPVAGGTYTGIYTNVAATDQATLLANKAWGDGTYGTFHVSSYGSNAMKSGQLFYNAGYDLGKDWSFYSFGNYSNKQVEAGAFLRTAVPASATSNVDLYPNGFAPKLPGTSIDYSVVAGFKRKVAVGWNMDFSTGYGKNTLAQYAYGSANASLGAASPKDFYVGLVGFGQSLTEANLSKNITGLGGTKSLNLAFGAQYRVDNFQLTAGDDAASIVGPLAATKNKTPGSQGRVGISKDDERTRSRSNTGLYLDVESDVTDRFLVAAAVRYENYSDFGGNTSGKLASRFKLTDALSVRGSINKGFRAPLLQQIASAATTSTVQAGTISSTKQLPSDDIRLKSIGITDPKPETSLNYNLGVTAKAGNNLLFTLDAYQIDIKDRIIITENFNTKDIAALKTLFAGIQQVTFFTNAISTQTKGVDLVMSYKNQINETNRFTGSIAFTANKTKINEAVVKAPDLMQAGTVATVLLLDTVSRALIETSQPHTKVLVSLGYQYKNFNINLRSTYFGEVTTWEKPTGLPHRAQTFAGKNIFDVSVSYNFNKFISLAVGGNNITNVYPDKVLQNYASYTNGQVPYTRNANQFGFLGSYYYGTVTVNF
jgi:iron complex outermembrane recepter protein